MRHATTLIIERLERDLAHVIVNVRVESEIIGLLIPGWNVQPISARNVERTEVHLPHRIAGRLTVGAHARDGSAVAGHREHDRITRVTDLHGRARIGSENGYFDIARTITKVIHLDVRCHRGGQHS